MKVPLSWLREMVDITLPLDELVHRLNMSGTEVERILDDFILSLRKLFQRLTFDLFHTHVSDNFLF